MWNTHRGTSRKPSRLWGTGHRSGGTTRDLALLLCLWGGLFCVSVQVLPQRAAQRVFSFVSNKRAGVAAAGRCAGSIPSAAERPSPAGGGSGRRPPRSRRDPAADHFQGGPGSRFENAGAAAGAAVRAGAAAGGRAAGHGRHRRHRQHRRGLGRAAAARLAPALLQPAAEAPHDGDRGGSAAGGEDGARWVGDGRTRGRGGRGRGTRGTRGHARFTGTRDVGHGASGTRCTRTGGM